MRQKQHETQKLCMEGTGEWFLQNDKFIEWKENAGVLWIEGSSGTGKSVLISTVIKQLFAKKTPSTAVVFFYFDFRNKEAQSVEIALRRIILQLSAQSPHPYKTLENHYKASNGQILPSYEDLQQILCELLHEFGHIYIALDALDECDQHNFHYLVDLVSTLQAWQDTSLHLLITSQTRDIFTKGFKGLICMELDAKVTGDDIWLFVANQLDTNTDLAIWKAHAKQICTKIVHKSSGMFRLAACLLVEFSHCTFQDELDETLENLPNDLFEVYDRFLQNIRPKDWMYVEALLRWIMFSHHSGKFWEGLTMYQLADAIAFDFSNASQYIYNPHRRRDNIHAIPKWLTGLIQVNGSSVILAHSSVQDYLLSDYFKQRFHSDLKENLSQRFISQTCISYLLYFGSHPLKRTEVVDYPLAEYAAKNWYQHLVESDDPNVFLSLVTQLLQDGSNQYCALLDLVTNWCNAVLPPFLFCCKEGYFECISGLIANGTNINTLNKEGSGLSLASCMGNIEIVDLLLKKGADINLEVEYYGSALGAAAFQGILDVVSFLLKKGADVNITNGHYGSVLEAAAYQGSLATVSLLLEHGANINLVGGHYGSALEAAAYQGSLKIVSFLLENGADINLAGGHYGSALGAAAYQGSLEIVIFLLEKGANINLAGGYYGSALSAAAYRGSLEIIILLLKNGADVNLTGGHYGSALGAVAYWGSPEIVSLLLENGADINLAAEAFQSALGTLSVSKFVEIIHLLAANRVDVERDAVEE
ncbi:ankyrin repeat-containing domain protein [Mycena haematopus]|nr:ankyrin repeat-containing domain protein [Mycena haematopus]